MASFSASRIESFVKDDSYSNSMSSTQPPSLSEMSSSQSSFKSKEGSRGQSPFRGTKKAKDGSSRGQSPFRKSIEGPKMKSEDDLKSRPRFSFSESSLSEDSSSEAAEDKEAAKSKDQIDGRVMDYSLPGHDTSLF